MLRTGSLFDSRTPRRAAMEHWSAIYALVARRRIHDFTLRKAQSDRLLGMKMAKRKSRLGIAPFDASEYLDNEEVIAEYLAAALEDRNPDVFLHAVADVAKARAISKVAKDAGTGAREPLQGSRAGCQDPV